MQSESNSDRWKTLLEDEERPCKDWVLSKESELRLEVDENDAVEIMLLFGVAEIFGTELAKNMRYTIGVRSKIALFTWTGCTFRIIGTPSVVYVSEETPMLLYINAHVAIDQLRHKAQLNKTKGPRVMVCGATDVGKSTLCKLLVNYAIRMRRLPMYVDLDVGQGNISIPGSIGAIPVDRPASIEDGDFAKQLSIVYFTCHTSPGDNIKLYNTMVSSLAKMCEEKCKNNEKNYYGGYIINTCGWIDGLGYKCLLHTVEAFNVDVVLVLDSERLHNDFQRDLPKSINILRLPKSGGAVVRSREFRRKTRDEAVREYFYGRRGSKNTFFPYSFDVPFSSISIYKIGAPQVPESCLPIGAQAEDGNTQLVPVDFDKDLMHCVCSLSMASTLEDDLVSSNSAGFVCINGINMDAQTLTVLAPAPSPLPRKYLILSNIKFVEIG